MSKRFFHIRTGVAAFAVACASTGAGAALVDRGGGVVYDTVSGLDWEQQPLATSVNWADANAYVSALSLDGGGWRMPSIAELTDLYAEITALTGCFDCSGDQGPFDGIGLGVWTPATYFAGQPGAFYVSFYKPATTIGLFQTSHASVWATREGRALPEPGSLALALAALSLAGGAGRLRRRGRRPTSAS